MEKRYWRAGESESLTARARRLWCDGAGRHALGMGKRGREIPVEGSGSGTLPQPSGLAPFSYKVVVPGIALTAWAVRGGGDSGRSRRCRGQQKTARKHAGGCAIGGGSH